MKKRMFSLILALALLCTLLPQVALSARAAAYSGSCGDNLTWSLNTETGLLTIEGNGEMANYTSDYTYQNQAPWFEYCDSITAVSLPAGLTSIGDGAFFSCFGLTSVTIPASVTSIGYRAFDGCRSLSGVVIPASVTSIGDGAFSYCTSLTSVTIPDGVTSIGECAFNECTSLTSVTIPDSGASIGNYAFSCCRALTSVTFPDSVTSIGTGAFDGCSSLTDVTIPDSVTSIGAGAFEGCSALTDVTIPDSVTSIGNKAFGYYYDKGYHRIAGFTIYGYTGSAAETYATENGFQFISLSMPVITTQPESQTVAFGNTVTFTVAATGSDLRYQWQYKKVGMSDWDDWTGKTAAAVSFRGVNSNNGCQYRCVVSNEAGSVTSAVATLTVLSKPVITSQPESQTVAYGETVTFTVAATGSNLRYQWQYKKVGGSWTNWTGKTASSVSFKGINRNNGCQYRCVISNEAGSVTSAAATLTVSSGANAVIRQLA